MTLLVVGGHSRDIGKTSVVAGLIQSIRPPEWTAVKITHYADGARLLKGDPGRCAPGQRGFLLTEERDRNGRGDSKRFLQAGARRSFWLRVRQGQLARALPVLLRALRREKWVMIESNSVLGLLDPALYLFVLDRSQREFKPSARQYLECADGLVAIGPPGGLSRWPHIDARVLASKPVFRVLRPEYASENLNRFVREKLGLTEGGASAGG